MIMLNFTTEKKHISNVHLDANNIHPGSMWCKCLHKNEKKLYLQLYLFINGLKNDKCVRFSTSILYTTGFYNNNN